MPTPPILSAALLCMTAFALPAQNVQWHQISRKLTTLGPAVPELASTLNALLYKPLGMRGPLDGEGPQHGEEPTGGTQIPGPAPAHTLRSAAWYLLALSSCGSGLRYGKHKHEFKTLVKWLRDQQEHPGTRVGFYWAPETARLRVDNTLANFAMLRACIESDYKLLYKYVDRGLIVLKEQFEQEGAAPANCEEVLLLAMLAESTRDTRWQDQRTTFLDLAKHGVPFLTPNKNRLHGGVRHYIELLDGKQHPYELTAALCWPGNLEANPLHAWLGAFTMQLLPKTDKQSHWPRVATLLRKRQPDHLWYQAGAANRRTRSAMLAAVLGMSIAPKPAKPKLEAIPKKGGDAWRTPIR